jgi:Cof subfamily protein (haloacid dehalogenase superfamily)
MRLYISDLDGTLLNSRQELSCETIQIINRCLAAGLKFTIATARSFDSAGPIIAPLSLQLPLILNNGVFIYDPVQKVDIVANLLETRIGCLILKKCEDRGVSPLLFTNDRQNQRQIFYRGIFHHGQEVYINDRLAKNDRRLTRIADLSGCLTPELQIIAIILIGEADSLAPIHRELKEYPEIGCHFTRDIYSGAYWLEIAHRNATKYWAAKYIKSYLGADQLICFGDNLNDLPLFQAADFCYAMDNAHVDLKKNATGVIGTNDQNGVAEFIRAAFEERSA